MIQLQFISEFIQTETSNTHLASLRKQRNKQTNKQKKTEQANKDKTSNKTNNQKLALREKKLLKKHESNKQNHKQTFEFAIL